MVDETDQTEQQGGEQQQPPQPTFTQYDLVEQLQYLGDDAKRLYDEVDEDTIGFLDPRVEELYRGFAGGNVPDFIARADFIKSEREKAEAAAAQKEADERARSDESVKAQIAADLERERAEAAEAERRDRIRQELLEEQAREAEGRTGPDPAAAARLRYENLATELDSPDITPERRVAIHKETEELEDQMEKGDTPGVIAFDINAWKESQR